MITTPALVFATVAFSAVCSFGAPIKVRRDGTEVQQIGRRFPQTIAADSPALVKKEVVDTPAADAIVRRFPRRIYYEHYNKRETPEVVERSPAPESAPESRSIADEASDDLAARKRRREMRRSADSTHFKRILQRDGVRARREEPKMKRSVVSQPVVAREPEPEPKTAPVIESRAFIPPAPAAIAARDTFIWKINAGGIKVEEITDVEQIQKINGLPLSGSGSSSTVQPTPTSIVTPTSTPSSTQSPPTGAVNGTTTGGSETQTPPPTQNPPATGNSGTGKGEEGSTPTPTTTSTSPSSTPSATSTGSGSKSPSSNPSSNPAENSTPSNGTATAIPCTNPKGCPTPISGTSSADPQKPGVKPNVMDTTEIPPEDNPSSNPEGTPDTGTDTSKRDEQSSQPVIRSGSMMWRRIPNPPSSSPSRRSESAPSRLQFRREH